MVIITLIEELHLLAFIDVSVFTGARSDVNQVNWFWNNGTMVANTTNYPASNASVCEQMTWPLTYDDGINLRAKECKSGLSHHVCRFEGMKNCTSVCILQANNIHILLYRIMVLCRSKFDLSML